MEYYRTKNNRSQIYKIIFLGIIGLVVVSVILLGKLRSNTSIPQAVEQITLLSSGDIDFRVLKEYWANRIDQLGGVKAYDEFKNLYILEDFSNQSLGTFVRNHGFMHLFGELLYEKVGMEGITICQDETHYGCFHGFFLAAIEKNGLPAITILNAQCKISSHREQCQHGIGHGILVYMGEQQLQKSLDICGSISVTALNPGCAKGVFMEYFSRFHQISMGVQTQGAQRPVVDPQNPGKICLSVQGDFRSSCWTIVAMHLIASLKDDARVVDICDAIPIVREREGCLSGIGRQILYEANMNVYIATNRCMKLPSPFALECRWQIAIRLYESRKFRKSAGFPCSQLSPAQKQYCLFKADLTVERLCKDLSGKDFSNCIEEEETFE